MPASPHQPASAASRKHNPEKARKEILDAAVAEFSQHGLSGARVDAIAERSGLSKRMIYYYFGSKEQLYLAVLEQLYSDIRTTEAELHLDELPPQEALRTLVEFTFEHHDSKVDFIRLVSIENIHHAVHLAESEVIRSMNTSVVAAIEGILARGVASGVFRPGIDARDIHMLFSAFCFFRVSNRHTFSTIHQVDFTDPETRARHKEMICEAVLRYCSV